MVATLGGLLALPLGLLVLLLPLLATELSRPRDSVWGALVLLLALVLVTSADRLTGAPMLGVVCSGLLIGRLLVEVGQARWRQLSPEEQQRLSSLERWTTSFGQLGATVAGLGQQLGGAVAGLGQGLGGGDQPAPPRVPAARTKATGKRWVRPETPSVEPEPAGDLSTAGGAPPATPAASKEPSAAAVAMAAEAPPAEPEPDQA